MFPNLGDYYFLIQIRSLEGQFFSESELACSREQWQHYLHSINASELIGENEMLFHFWTGFNSFSSFSRDRNESLMRIDLAQTSWVYIQGYFFEGQTIEMNE